MLGEARRASIHEFIVSRISIAPMTLDSSIDDTSVSAEDATVDTSLPEEDETNTPQLSKKKEFPKLVVVFTSTSTNLLLATCPLALREVNVEWRRQLAASTTQEIDNKLKELLLSHEDLKSASMRAEKVSGLVVKSLTLMQRLVRKRQEKSKLNKLWQWAADKVKDCEFLTSVGSSAHASET